MMVSMTKFDGVDDHLDRDNGDDGNDSDIDGHGGGVSSDADNGYSGDDNKTLQL